MGKLRVKNEANPTEIDNIIFSPTLPNTIIPPVYTEIDQNSFHGSEQYFHKISILDVRPEKNFTGP